MSTNLNYQILNQDSKSFTNSLFCPNFDFIVADPPFNIGQSYQDYDDSMPTEEYRQFTFDWILNCWNKLKPGCVFVIHASVKASREVLRALFKLGLDENIVTEICWAYNFGQCTFHNFIETHCRAVVLRKPGKNKKWYVEEVMTPSKRLLMGDKRVKDSKHKGMIPFGTVWGVKTVDGVVTEPIEGIDNWGRIQGNNSERRQGHPNQLPEHYVGRLFKAYSASGDLCYCPFGGSGTETVVGLKLGRKMITTEVSPWACKSIESRINESRL